MMLYGLKLQTRDICDHAYNGRQALEAVKKNVAQNNGKFCNYNLILIDCNMPFMDGYEATTAIRDYLYKMNLEQPIITAVTGHVEDNNVNKGLACGMNQIISKPINFEVMKHLLYQMYYLEKWIKVEVVNNINSVKIKI